MEDKNEEAMRLQLDLVDEAWATAEKKVGTIPEPHVKALQHQGQA